MNQILITGDEQVTRKVAQKEKKVLPINVIVIFFAISIIILGICMVGGSLYSRYQINETVAANKKPEISVERIDEDNVIAIDITHIRGIKTITYSWNDEEEITIDGKNRKTISETIDLIGGENTLKIVVTEENGQTQTLEKTFKVGNIPEIKILEAVDNGIKISASSEVEIDYLQYNWDDGEMQKIEVGESEYEGIISAPKGLHTLKIEVVDTNGMKAELKKNVVGDTEPTINIKSELINGKATFIVDVEDDEGITTIQIVHNGGTKEIIDVNAKTYNKEVIMTEGETNTIMVIATNKNGLQKTRGVKFENK